MNLTDIEEKLFNLEEVHGSTFCKYSIIENKLATLYRNQKRIMLVLQLILLRINGSTQAERRVR